jgi:hypothetical protein
VTNISDNSKINKIHCTSANLEKFSVPATSGLEVSSETSAFIYEVMEQNLKISEPYHISTLGIHQNKYFE